MAEAMGVQEKMDEDQEEGRKYPHLSFVYVYVCVLLYIYYP